MRRFIIFLVSIPTLALAQDENRKVVFSGNFQNTNQFYFRDDRIGANTIQYRRQLSSSDAWLYTNTTWNGFALAVRFDVFNNTPLFNPQQAYTNSGLGYWQISKDIDNLNVTAGYFYDQFGTGTLFRAYEDRNIGIDYAIQGVRLKYQVGNLRLKAFTGKQKFRFGFRDPVIKGCNAEYTVNFSDQFQWEPGVALLNRTMDDASMNKVLNTINNQPESYIFSPRYNNFGISAYQSLRYKNFRLYLEYVHKSREAIKDLNNPNQYLVNKSGQVYFASLSYSKKGLGINAQYKRIESFPMRTSPNELLLDGVMNYLPSITRQNTFRLLARYNAVVQEMGEQALQADALWTPSKKTQVSVNASKVTKLNGDALFYELYADFTYKWNKKLKTMVGIQRVGYNQAVYEVKPGYAFVKTITPFGEVYYKFNKKHSVRAEFQVLDTKQDLGSFINILAEFNVAPTWSFAAGDMINYKPYRQPDSPIPPDKIHYYTFFSSYSHKATRFTLAWVKQVQGVNCTGGVCRVEPAFNGIRFTCSTSF